METYIILQEGGGGGHILLLPSPKGWSLPAIIWGRIPLHAALKTLGIEGRITSSIPVSSGPIHVVWAYCDRGQSVNRSHAWVDMKDIAILGVTETVKRLLSVSARVDETNEVEKEREIELPSWY